MQKGFCTVQPSVKTGVFVMKMVQSLHVLAAITVLMTSTSAMAATSTSTGANGKTTSSQTGVTKNGNGTLTRTSSFTGTQGKSHQRSAMRGNGSSTINRAHGGTRTTTP
jgi:hypothetical protein